MMRNKILIGGIALIGLALILMAIPQRASSGMAQQPAGDAESVPAFHSQVPAGPLPATLSPELFSDVLVQNAYCHCDRSQGHGSLLDCFAGKHAAECGVCIREGLYSYEQTRKGKTAAQIRDGIEHGEWQHVDLTKYQSPISTK
jgi:hypothetical protein